MKDWRPSQEVFEHFLATLDADRERAGARYELMRRKLVMYFTVRHCPAAEDLTDETIDRVMRKLAEGEHITTLMGYAYGVARLVHLEFLRAERRTQTLAAEQPDEAGPVPEPDATEARRRCFEHCLAQLAETSERALLVEYYQPSTRSLIEHRRAMALRLGVSQNTLRLRAFRLRGRLEKCINECMATGT